MLILAAVQFVINIALIWLVFRLARGFSIYKRGYEEADAEVMRVLDDMDSSLRLHRAKQEGQG